MQTIFDNHKEGKIQIIDLPENLVLYNFVSENQANPHTEMYAVDINDMTRIIVMPKALGMELRSRIFLYQNGDLESLNNIKYILNL